MSATLPDFRALCDRGCGHIATWRGVEASVGGGTIYEVVCGFCGPNRELAPPAKPEPAPAHWVVRSMEEWHGRVREIMGRAGL